MSFSKLLRSPSVFILHANIYYLHEETCRRSKNRYTGNQRISVFVRTSTSWKKTKLMFVNYEGKRRRKTRQENDGCVLIRDLIEESLHLLLPPQKAG
jgi:hypothetical protein